MIPRRWPARLTRSPPASTSRACRYTPIPTAAIAATPYPIAAFHPISTAIGMAAAPVTPTATPNRTTAAPPPPPRRPLGPPRPIPPPSARSPPNARSAPPAHRPPPRGQRCSTNHSPRPAATSTHPLPTLCTGLKASHPSGTRSSAMSPAVKEPSARPASFLSRPAADPGSHTMWARGQRPGMPSNPSGAGGPAWTPSP